MKISRLLLLAVAISSLLSAQTPEERKRFQDIQERHKRGEQINADDMQFAKGMMAKMRQQQGQQKGQPQGGHEAWAKDHPARESTGLVPLPELGKGMYQGFEGGLYPDGRNTPPAAHLKAGLKAAKSVVPLDAEGKPSPDGKIVLLSCGMSNTTMEYHVFQQKAAQDTSLNPRLTIVDGAQGGKTAKVTANPQAPYWEVNDQRLAAAGVTGKQVQVVWIKQANAGPSEGFPAAAKALQNDVVETLHNLHDRFPNLKIAYLSSRIYAGYATSPLNPEPYAYEGGFAMKWIIADQIAGKPELNYDPAKGAVKAPWVAWGPYLWMDGMKPRKSDGATWLKDDVVPTDRTHPSDSGRDKVAAMLLTFLKTDPTSKPWFVKP
jgi:hypothetical protein